MMLNLLYSETINSLCPELTEQPVCDCVRHVTIIIFVIMFMAIFVLIYMHMYNQDFYDKASSESKVMSDLLVSSIKSHQKELNLSALCVFRPFVNPTRSPAVATASVECVLNDSKLTTNIV